MSLFSWMLISEYFSCVNYNHWYWSRWQAFHCGQNSAQFVNFFLLSFFSPRSCVWELTGGGGNQYLPVLSWQSLPFGGRGVGGYRKCCTAPLGPNRKTLPLPGKFATLPCISKCHIFVQFSLPGMKNSPVGNLLTRLNDTVFIFEAKKQSKRENVRDIWLLHNWCQSGRWKSVVFEMTAGGDAGWWYSCDGTLEWWYSWGDVTLAGRRSGKQGSEEARDQGSRKNLVHLGLCLSCKWEPALKSKIKYDLNLRQWREILVQVKIHMLLFFILPLSLPPPLWPGGTSYTAGSHLLEYN